VARGEWGVPHRVAGAGLAVSAYSDSADPALRVRSATVSRLMDVLDYSLYGAYRTWSEDDCKAAYGCEVCAQGTADHDVLTKALLAVDQAPTTRKAVAIYLRTYLALAGITLHEPAGSKALADLAALAVRPAGDAKTRRGQRVQRGSA
jgi:hypothetical protein